MTWAPIGAPRQQLHTHAASESSVKAARYKADLALWRVDAFIDAAAAAERNGSWKPGAASNYHDYSALSAAADLLEITNGRYQMQQRH